MFLIFVTIIFEYQIEILILLVYLKCCKKIRFLIVSKTLYHEKSCFNTKPLFAA